MPVEQLETEAATEIKKAIDERKPQREERDRKLAEQQSESTSTIAMLERRTKEQTIDLELEGGDRLRIYSRMSQADQKKLEVIEEERNRYILEADSLISGVKSRENASQSATKENFARIEREITACFDKAGDCWLKTIAMITVDPEITYEWLKANPDKYSSEDIVDAYFAYREARKQQIADRHERVKRAISFRKDFSGEGVRTISPLDENSRPEGVGGTAG